MNDVNSTTGKNLRNILLMTDKSCVEELKKSDVELVFHNTAEYDMWKNYLINDLIEFRDGNYVTDILTDDEIEDTLNWICAS